MTPHPTANRLFAAAALLLGLGALALPASAQGTCGDSYTIRSGDTLSAVAAKCGLALPEVLAANPGIEPRRLAVGQAVALPGAAQAAVPAPSSSPAPAPAATPASPQDDTAAVQPPAQQGMAGPADVAEVEPHKVVPENANYTVRAADSLQSIAQAFGTTVTAIVKDNPQLNRQTALVAGQRLYIAGAAQKDAVPSLAEGTPWSTVHYIPGAAVEVLPRRVEPGDLVTVYARGFPARTLVDIAAGDPAGALVVLEQETTDNYGTLRARVSVPTDIPAGAPLAVVIATPNRAMAARSANLTVQAAGTPQRHEPGAAVEIVGTLTDEGVECPAMRTDDGALYTLTGHSGGLLPGERVRVVGLIAGASMCQQGVTVSAARIEVARPERAAR